MSLVKRNNGSHNVYYDFPPIMSDGRNFANWISGATLNNNLKDAQDIKTNFEYRQYLTKNADTLIKMNQEYACDQCCNCPPTYSSGNTNATQPFLFTSCLDTTKPDGYEESDMKGVYLTSYQLETRMRTPVITQHELIKNGFPNFN